MCDILVAMRHVLRPARVGVRGLRIPPTLCGLQAQKPEILSQEMRSTKPRRDLEVVTVQYQLDSTAEDRTKEQDPLET
jgi:hypothetical protein